MFGIIEIEEVFPYPAPIKNFVEAVASDDPEKAFKTTSPAEDPSKKSFAAELSQFIEFPPKAVGKSKRQ